VGETLEHAGRRVAAWSAGVARPAGPSGDELVAAVRAAIADDLDTPAALAAVDAWCAADGSDNAAPQLVRATVDALLGVDL
jgi:L-cysteine:1D-myo-inositol 2-amino-2-deoxy-alpha-D-glucopyranoside ligase